MPPNRTIGREHDVVAVGERLRRGAVRLLTLTGPGGVGKTRLAVEAARAVEADFADGAHFVSLAALRRPEDVPAAIVKALGIVVLSGESAEQAAERFLAAKHLLLVRRQLRARCWRPRRSSAGCSRPVRRSRCWPPVASRSRCRPRSATRWRRSRCPRARRRRRAALAGVDAVALFCERARAHDPGFDLDDANATAVAEICRRVDGLPLAIELAAARCGLLSPARSPNAWTPRSARSGAGARDAPARQQTLRATIDWSHELLSDAEQQCFARFAVFAGGATVEAAETITGAGLDTLDGLVAKSLLVRRQHAHAPTRLGMLETIRAYAGERFASAADERGRPRAPLPLLPRARPAPRNRTRALGRRRQGAPRPAGRRDRQPPRGPRAGRSRQADAERALALAAALGCYWIMRNRYADAVDWIDQALSLPGADAHPALRVRALCTKARCLWPLGRGAEQPAVVAEVEAIARRLGDPVILSQALQLRVDHEIDAERLDVADALADEALHWARAAGDEWEIAEASRGKAIAASEHRRSARARRHGRLAAHRRRQRPSPREPAHRRGLRRALPRQRS